MRKPVVKIRVLSIALALLVASLAAAFSGPALAQQPAPSTAAPPSQTPASGQSDQPPQAKIDELIRLLQDPAIRQWLASVPATAQKTVAPTPAAATRAALPAAEPDPSSSTLPATDTDPSSMDMMASNMSAWEERTRGRIHAVVTAIPDIPAALADGMARLRADAMARGSAPVLVLIAALIFAGMVVEAIFRRRWRQHGGGAQEFLPVAVFAATMAVLFFAFDWPPLSRIVMACYLTAFVAYRLVATAIGLTAHPELHRRLRLLAGILAFAIATGVAVSLLDLAWPVRHAIAYVFSCVLLALGVETVWAKMKSGPGIKAGLSIYLVSLWVVWCLGLRAAFWLGLYAFVLPPILKAVSHAVRDRVARHLSTDHSDTRIVLTVRGVRALIIALAVAWIALIWEVDRDALIHDNPQYSVLFYGILKSIIVLLLADLAWHLAKAAIDRQVTGQGFGSPLATAVPLGEDGAPHMGSDTGAAALPAVPAHEAQATRLSTLLPILRNVLAVALFIVAGIVVLGDLGVEIGPLIAGAGILGVAIGFGSQTLVKDVISGFFYLFDDAFRVGEYIQAKSYKGTVEGFSLRSVKLRHHRGPVFTIPFGELGAVENMSRDWAKAKFLVSVPYDTDIEKARKIGKSIGQQMLEDPEIGSLFIQPLKMKGVEEFGEYGIVISFAMITVPTNQQSYIRRKAYAMLRDAFRENGIAFAQPTVNVGGGNGDTAGGAAAAEATRRARIAAAEPDAAAS
ncbi:MAG: mechanosensitive ion channel [Neorhizobium sp.]|nr:mechanosensitive ion channel [Neorhizobium sp.]